ncbi:MULTISPECIES: hypothetical protein [Bacillaceae]|uniref:hypothetical protein n=1 Tax=Bacillaceae TaxID=186817 RepID=UPI002FFD8077
MNSRLKILKVTQWAGGITLITGIMVFLYGIIISHMDPVIGIGIGTIVGSVMFFLVGMLFIATEEMVENTDRGIEMAPIKPKLYLVKR